MISLWGVPAGAARRAGPGRRLEWNNPAIQRVRGYRRDFQAIAGTG